MNSLKLISRTVMMAGLLIGNLSFAEESPNINTIKPSPQLEQLVPEAYRNGNKTLVVGVNPDVAPVKFVDEDGDLTGMIPDLANAAAKKLGVKLNYQLSSFDALIPGIKANRFTFLLSLADLSSRQGVITFVDYLKTGVTIMAPPERNYTINSQDDLCGLSIAIVRGTATVERAEEQSKKCQAEGKKPIKVVTYPDTNSSLLTLSNNSSDVAWEDSPVADYFASKYPQRYKNYYYTYVSPYGVGFSNTKDGNQLAHAFQAAFQELQKEGIYSALISKWGLSEKEAIPTFDINGAK